jgi:beta-mannosidase  (EC 3.2.1.25)
LTLKRYKKGKNSLKVEIRSPINIPRTFERKYGKLGRSGETAMRCIRKAQYSYGWDWGARMATSGIWKPVHIETYKKLEFMIHTKSSNS